MSTDTMHCRTRDEILAVPISQFGFTPHESVVFLRLRNKSVVFSARVDLDELSSHPLEVLASLRSAATHLGDGRWVLLAWASEPEARLSALRRMATLLDQVQAAFITDGATSWEITAEAMIDPQPFNVEAGLEPLSAIRHRDDLHATRADAVAQVGEWDPTRAWWAEARELVWRLEPADQLELLRDLAEAGVPQGKDRTLVACLLGEEECFAEMVAQMSVASAATRRALLHAVRAEAPPEALANVTALLALAYWLEGNGTFANECLDQLLPVDPGHPLGQTVAALIRLGIPPALWDEH